MRYDPARYRMLRERRDTNALRTVMCLQIAHTHPALADHYVKRAMAFGRASRWYSDVALGYLLHSNPSARAAVAAHREAER